MAKGQHLTPYQMGIVKRFYEHRDTVLGQRLAELVSDIYLTTSEKALAKLWKSADDTMRKAGVDDAQSAEICTQRKIADLAAVVSALSASPQRSAPRKTAAPADDF